MRDFQNAYPNDGTQTSIRNVHVGPIIITVGEKPRRNGEE